MIFINKNRSKPYNENLKKLIVNQYYSGNTVKELSNKYSVSEVSIYRWINRLQSFKNNPKTHKNSVLEKKILELKKENEILKKAIVILTKDKSAF